MLIDTVSDSKLQLSFKKLLFVRNSLVVQSLRLCASTAGGVGVTPGVVIKVPQAMQHSQNKHAHTHAKKETTICGILV